MSSYITPEDATNKIQRIFTKRGKRALDIAREEMLNEKIESREARRALIYFITKYWQDLARPSLMSIACEAVGGDPELTTPVAVSMILISGAIDIHDDIIDKSKRKGGRPTVYGKFGKDVALLVGDALLFKGQSLLSGMTERGLSRKKAAQVIDIVKRTFFELGDAEALELNLRHRLDVSPEEYLHVVRKKAADVEAHTRISALLGGATQDEIKALSEYGRLLGMLLILRDDWIDMIDLDESCHRLTNEGLPLPLLYILRDPNIRTRVRSIIGKRKVTKRDAQEILEITEEEGGMKKYKRFAHGLGKRALLKIKNIKRNKEHLHLLVRGVLPSR